MDPSTGVPRDSRRPVRARPRRRPAAPRRHHVAGARRACRLPARPGRAADAAGAGVAATVRARLPGGAAGPVQRRPRGRARPRTAPGPPGAGAPAPVRGRLPGPRGWAPRAGRAQDPGNLRDLDGPGRRGDRRTGLAPGDVRAVREPPVHLVPVAGPGLGLPAEIHRAADREPGPPQPEWGHRPAAARRCRSRHPARLQQREHHPRLLSGAAGRGHPASRCRHGPVPAAALALPDGRDPHQQLRHLDPDRVRPARGPGARRDPERQRGGRPDLPDRRPDGRAAGPAAARPRLRDRPLLLGHRPANAARVPANRSADARSAAIARRGAADRRPDLPLPGRRREPGGQPQPGRHPRPRAQRLRDHAPAGRPAAVGAAGPGPGLLAGSIRSLVRAEREARPERLPCRQLPARGRLARGHLPGARQPAGERHPAAGGRAESRARRGHLPLCDAQRLSRRRCRPRPQLAGRRGAAQPFRAARGRRQHLAAAFRPRDPDRPGRVRHRQPALPPPPRSRGGRDDPRPVRRLPEPDPVRRSAAGGRSGGAQRLALPDARVPPLHPGAAGEVQPAAQLRGDGRRRSLDAAAQRDPDPRGDGADLRGGTPAGARDRLLGELRPRAGHLPRSRRAVRQPARHGDGALRAARLLRDRADLDLRPHDPLPARGVGRDQPRRALPARGDGVQPPAPRLRADGVADRRGVDRPALRRPVGEPLRRPLHQRADDGPVHARHRRRGGVLAAGPEPERGGIPRRVRGRPGDPDLAARERVELRLAPGLRQRARGAGLRRRLRLDRRGAAHLAEPDPRWAGRGARPPAHRHRHQHRHPGRQLDRHRDGALHDLPRRHRGRGGGPRQQRRVEPAAARLPAALALARHAALPHRARPLPERVPGVLGVRGCRPPGDLE